LCNVSCLIIIVAAEIKDVLEPVKEGDLSIGVVSANHQDYGMDQDEPVNEMSKLERSVGAHQNHKSDHGRKDFEEPGKIVVRLNYRPDKNSKENYKPKGTICFFSCHDDG